MIKLLTLLLIASVGLVQCDTTDPTVNSNCPDAQEYLLKNLTGLDGCGWVLAQGDQSFEPINLGDYISDPVQDQVVMLEIIEREDFASICLVGTIVEITCQ